MNEERGHVVFAIGRHRRAPRHGSSVSLHPLTIIITVLVIALLGCGRPKFVAPSAGGVELATHNGYLWIVPGHQLLADGTMGTQQNLLHVLIVCPGLAANERGTETRYGERVNSYIARWRTSNGPVVVAIDWDKHADTITTGGRTFGRSTGNVFVVKRELTGALSSTQLPSLSVDERPERILRFIQQQMSDDPVITGIELPLRH